MSHRSGTLAYTSLKQLDASIILQDLTRIQPTTGVSLTDVHAQQPEMSLRRGTAVIVASAYAAMIALGSAALAVIQVAAARRFCIAFSVGTSEATSATVNSP